ncbi:putative phage membrane protein [Burkholderia pseudomallei]|nr:putative phage membrane protein [Burkholderia pseudomallei]CAJ8800003.1 putative phage membrane protein [Burkholderia pseudomallei]CAJ9292701.1 putative phage membrane protein [Burkholderia pseudomallei]
MTPFDYLGAWLERLRKRSPVVAYIVAIAIAAACTIAAASLNQDGTSAVPVPVRTV